MRLHYLLGILGALAIMVGVVTIWLLYDAALEQQRARLVETAQSRARLIEAMGRFDAIHSRDYPGGAEEATLYQIREAHRDFMGFGETGEFTLARRESDKLRFLLRHRHSDLEAPLLLPFPGPDGRDPSLAEPMVEALKGRSGTMEGIDYRGARVLAAFEPVAVLNLGIVAKIDLAEVRAPFIRAGWWILGLSVCAILLAVITFRRFGNPIIRKMEEGETLRVSREGLAQAQSIARLGSWEWDVGTDALTWSDEVHRITGVSPEAFGGAWSAFLAVVHPEDRVAMQSAVDAVLAAPDQTLQFVHRLCRPDGEERVVRSRAEVRVGDHGLAVTVVGVLQDITEQHRVEAELEAERIRFLATFEQAAVGLAHIGLDGRFLRLNHRFCEIVERTMESLSELNLQQLTHPDDMDEDRLQAARLLNGEIGGYRTEKRFIKSDQSSSWVQLTISLVRSRGGAPHFFVAVIEDIHERKAIAETLRFTQFAVDHVADMVFQIDARGRILYANQAALDRSGLSQDGWDGLSIWDLNPDFSPETWGLHWEDLKRMRRLTFESLHRDGEGAVFAVEVVANYVAYRDQGINWAFVRDISVRKKAEAALTQSEKKYRQLMETANDAVFIADAETGTIVDANQMAAEMVGRPLDELIGMHQTLLHPPEEADRYRALFVEHVRTGRNIAEDLFLLCKDGRRIPVDIRANVTEIDGRMLIQGNFRDISERKRAEQEIRDANAFLEKRVAERTAALEKSNQDLQLFAYAASHDLKEPLRQVSGFVQLLEKRLSGALDEKSKQYLGHVLDGSQRMQELIDALLTYSRLGTHARPFETVDMELVVARVIKSLGLLVRETGARIVHDPLPKVIGDAVQLGQLFQNLLGNALKFRVEERPSRIEIHYALDNGMHLFSVKDNGIGIEARHRERVFQLFQRLHNRSEFPGTGIGLAICQRIVERHGGGIWVESGEGEGSAFNFSLPVAPAAPTDLDPFNPDSG